MSICCMPHPLETAKVKTILMVEALITGLKFSEKSTPGVC